MYEIVTEMIQEFITVNIIQQLEVEFTTIEYLYVYTLLVFPCPRGVAYDLLFVTHVNGSW